MSSHTRVTQTAEASKRNMRGEKKMKTQLATIFFLVIGNFWFNFQTWIFQLNSAVPSTKQPSVKPSRTKLFHSELSVTVLVSESLDFSPLFQVQWKFWVKGGLISETFFTSAPSPKKGAKSLFWAYFLSVDSAQDRDLAHFFGDNKKLSEIKPPLVAQVSLFNLNATTLVFC